MFLFGSPVDGALACTAMLTVTGAGRQVQAGGGGRTHSIVHIVFRFQFVENSLPAGSLEPLSQGRAWRHPAPENGLWGASQVHPSPSFLLL